MPGDLDAPLLEVGRSSRRKMFESVVRERCKGVRRDGPASLSEGAVEECSNLESRFVLFDRMGGRRWLWPLSSPPASSWLLVFCVCDSRLRMKFPSDDLLRLCLSSLLATGCPLGPR